MCSGQRCSHMRQLLLHKVMPLTSLGEIIAKGPVYQRRSPMLADSARFAALAGVPDGQGLCNYPVQLDVLLPRQARGAVSLAATKNCAACGGSSARRLACSACSAEYCHPGAEGCDALHAGYAAPSAHGDWLCPDCRQLHATRAVCAGAPSAPAAGNAAQRAMDTLASSPAAYPAASAPLVLPNDV